VILLSTLVLSLLAQQNTIKQGTVERIKVHGKALEGNLSGDSPDRDVTVYLPASYKTSRNQRYPVIYMLHGFTDSDDKWMGLTKHWINLPQILDKALAANPKKEVIVVMPNAFTAFHGSMYSTSVTTGDWETYIAKELVSYVDSHYRTLPQVESRGLAGHSMGGYGAARIGMRHPEIFSSIYLLSPCCMMPNLGAPPNRTGPSRAEAVQSLAEVEKADFGTKAQLASAAAWSPNPKNPPLFLDLPTKNGEPQPAVTARWSANAPLAMVDQYIPNLKRLKAIAFDAGHEDRSIAASIKVLNEKLTAYGVQHVYESYEGNHVNKIGERIETKMMPFFSEHLMYERARK